MLIDIHFASECKTVKDNLCSSNKYPYFPHRRDWNLPKKDQKKEREVGFLEQILDEVWIFSETSLGCFFLHKISEFQKG